MEEKIVMPYAPILVESTRSIGYSFEAAVADIIDNSISAAGPVPAQVYKVKDIYSQILCVRSAGRQGQSKWCKAINLSCTFVPAPILLVLQINTLTSPFLTFENNSFLF